MIAPELKEKDSSPQHSGMCTSAHELQTSKQLSWFVEHTARLYFLWYLLQSFEQFQFQQMILILLHYRWFFSPWDVLTYIFTGGMSSLLSVLILSSFLGRMRLYCSCCISHLSIWFCSLCLQDSLSALYLCCSILCSCVLICYFIYSITFKWDWGM